MVVTLTGDNGFALLRELKKLVEKQTAKYGDLSVEQIDCAEVDAGSVIRALVSPPFLSPKKLVVLRQASLNKDLAQQLPGLMEQIPETTDTVIVEEQIDKRVSLYKFLKAQTRFSEFKTLDQAETVTWLVELARVSGASISGSNARYLIERVGLNQERLDNELAKLVLYNQIVTKESIDLLTEVSPSSSIFDLMEAAFSGNSKRVIKLYDEQRQLRVEPQQILSMLSWQLHILLLVGSAGDRTSDNIAREAGLNPFVVRKSRDLSKKIPLGRISRLVSELLSLDIRSKTKSIDLDDGLTHYLLSI